MTEWVEVSLAQVAERVTRRAGDFDGRVMTVAAGQGLVDQEAYFTKRIASKDTSAYWRVAPGDFVYNKSASKDAPWGVNARHRGALDAIVTPLYFVFRPDHRRVDPRFFEFAINGQGFFGSLAGSLREGARAHGALNVRLDEFFSARFLLPPLEEQKRIVAVVDAVDSALGALEAESRRIAANVTHARLGLLKVGVRGPWGSVKTGEFSALDWTKEMPVGWRAETIGSVSKVRSGATPRRSEQARYFDNGLIRWVKTGDLNEGVIADTDECITDVAIAETSVRLLPRDTVLVAMYGGFGQIGRTARLGIEAATNQAISALTELRDDVAPEFVHEVLKAGRSKWRLVAASSRKDPNISKRDVEQFDFPLPPSDEQRAIVGIVAGIEATRKAIDAESTCLRRLRAALVGALLAREVTVGAAVDRFIEQVL